LFALLFRSVIYPAPCSQSFLESGSRSDSSDSYTTSWFTHLYARTVCVVW